MMKWPTVSLGELSTLGPQYGANVKAVAPVGGRPRYVRITDIDETGDLRPDSRVEAATDSLNGYALEEGDILLARSGATVGKPYLYSSVDGPCVFAGYLIRFRPNPRLVCPKYLSYFLRTPTYWSWIGAKKRTAAQPNVNGAEYASLTIPLPVLPEQRRIVEILDQADALRKLRATADAKAERILPALFYKMFGDPATNPMGWNVERFGTLLVEPPRNGVSPSTGGAFLARVLTLSAITGKRFDASAVKEGDFAAPPSGNRLVDARDFLICRGNGNRSLVGRGWFPNPPMPDTVFPDTIIACRPNDDRVDGWFLETIWNSPFVRRQIETQARTTSGIYKINQDIVGAIEILVPPVERQRVFGRAAHSVAGLQMREVRERLDSLFGSLLHRGFSGDLTAQWRAAHMQELLAEMEQQAKALATAEVSA